MVKFSEDDPDLKYVLDVLSDDRAPSPADLSKPVALGLASQEDLTHLGIDTIFMPQPVGTKDDWPKWDKLCECLAYMVALSLTTSSTLPQKVPPHGTDFGTISERRNSSS